MPDAGFIDGHGRQVLLIDFSNASHDQGVVETGEKAMQLVRSVNVRHSIRGLIDLSGTSLNRVVVRTLKKMSQNNGPFMNSVAFVGFSPAWSQVVRILLYLSGRSNHRVFATRQEALDWLIST